MEDPKKELIKGIADLFEDYEETYVPGEWESFSKVRKKKYPFFAQWIKIAAVFLLLLSVLPFMFSKFFHQEKAKTVTVMKKGTENHVTQKKPVEDEKPVDVIAANKDYHIKEGQASKNQYDRGSEAVDAFAGIDRMTAVVQPEIIRKDQNSAVRQFSKERLFNDDVAEVARGQVVAAESKIQTVPSRLRKDTVIPGKRNQLSTAEFLLAESKTPVNSTIKKNEHLSKWDFGVQVMPAATSSNLNLGAGLTTAYRLSDKFSLSSGISFLQMEAGGTIPSRGGDVAAVSTLSEKKLTAVDANIKAIDIPIALVFKLNKHFYTSAGVSYFNVISEKRSNTFEQTAQVDKQGVDPQTGYASTYKTLFVEKVDEPTSEKNLKGNSYLGFFNFSVGRQQTLFNKYNIRIEPFIKIPVGKLSSQDLQLMNSGIKFQLSF
ncbi:hypothetical protein [Pedobacter cryoconitis]|uniref:Outer membrane protein beta-barrel domain-containing protein n=1 Tax=Pedobacter cryoconitis TaxID=188932 RepID=A0A7X0J658_9SPHI|nr:hypothetical protein [Pedobacter cryoconitis]MBB6501608.1 hypothetical protein [Pedobacter cryoconitis]